MLWRHRFATDEWGWELPGGIANTDEDLAATATREVIEETGWKPATVERPMAFQPMPGMVDTPLM
jgi:8-oxo-dGTP pyrophosphatase MutT (NUDIX family)